MGPLREVTEVHDWQTLAEQLLVGEGDLVDSRGSPTLVRVYGEPFPGSDLRLDTSVDPRFLIGWVAPPGCLAVALVATGKAFALDDGAAGGVVDCELARVRLCCVVGRSGRIGWSMTGPGYVSSAPAPSEGRLLDALKRCFGLATPPPTVPASVLHATAWAASVLAVAIESPRPLTWAEVSRAHPLARLLGGDLPAQPSAPDGDADDLTDLVRIAANAWSWQEIRAQACDGHLEALVQPGVAQWMDDGMFSRWVLGRLPPLDQLMAALRAYLVPSAAARLETALR